MATILVVDDYATNRQVLTALLGYGGHRLLEAGDGLEALERVRAEKPDLVISDILMPTMDGIEFVQHLHADPGLAQTPVIFYTATYRLHEAHALAQLCGVSRVLSKHSEPAEILRVVNAALGPKGAPVPAPASSPPEGNHKSPALASDHSPNSLATLRALERQVVTLTEAGLEVTTHLEPRYEFSDKLAASLTTLQGLSLRMTTLIEAGLELTAQRDPLRLLETLCRAAQDIVGGKYVAVGILDEEQPTLRHFVARGIDPETQARLGAPAPRAGLLGRVLAERRPLRLSNLRGDLQPLGLPVTHPPIESFLGVPIEAPAQVYGWLYLANTLGAAEFSLDDEQLATTLSTQMALAYENLKLYETIQQHAAELRLEVLERQRAEAALREKNEEVAVMSQQLWHVAKLATMGELTASIAHELNNPLATVSLWVESLLRQVPADDPNRQALHVMEQEVERMGALVANLLQSSRQSTLQLSTVDVCEEVEKSLELIQYHLRKYGITVVREFVPKAPTLQADRQHLRQLFLNLLTNASDAMPQGGTLTVRAAAGLLEGGAATAVIEFADTGMGVAPEEEVTSLV